MAGKEGETLPNGAIFPWIGLGTWLSDDPAALKNAIRSALDAGYRHLNTATMYNNKEVIGEVLQQEYFGTGKLSRQEVFITTKLPPFGMATPERFIKQSLEKLKVDYIDLFLIHTPKSWKLASDGKSPERDAKGNPITDPTPLIDTWRVLEDYHSKGVLKAIGVSNFSPAQLTELCSQARVKPMNNQVELHIFWPQDELVAVCRQLGIAVTSYASLGSPGSAHKRGEKPDSNCLAQPLVQELAGKYGKTPAQILLRQLIQRGIHVIPKSINATRVVENFGVFNFEISTGDMERMKKEITCRVKIFN